MITMLSSPLCDHNAVVQCVEALRCVGVATYSGCNKYVVVFAVLSCCCNNVDQDEMYLE
eukprot:m.233091 g.233091  ORF g.233091 m.233091 type:complete len:59 (+) comp33632_c0_seq13:2613-2789(+)